MTDQTPDPIDVIDDALENEGFGYWIITEDAAAVTLDALAKAGYRIVSNIPRPTDRKTVERAVKVISSAYDDTQRSGGSNHLAASIAVERLMAAGLIEADR